MTALFILSALIVGMAAGGFAVYLICGKRRNELTSALEDLRLKNIETETALDAEIKRHAAEKKLISDNCEQKLALLKEHYNRTFSEMEKTHQARNAQLKEEFKVLSDKILEDKSGKLQSANKIQMEAILNPLREKLTEFKTAVEESKTKNIELASTLTAQLGKMMEETNRIGGEARSLVNALKGEQKTQGDWGEFILEDILQRSGLVNGIHYECQETIRDVDGNTVTGSHDKKMRPDVIIHYPDGKDLIVDSKVSLSAYVDYMNAEDDTSRKNALDRHLRSVKNHVAELVKKDYSAGNTLSGRDTVDFVIMFIPNEAPFQLAMISEPNLWHEAFKNKVMIISPLNLMALLKIIHIAWTREEQSRNQQEIVDTAAVLMDRLYGFYEDFDAIGAELNKLQTVYDKATNRLKQGERNHSIVNSGEKLRKLGVRMNKQRKLPSRLQIELEEE